jgi:uncharacterized membrane protein
VAWRALGVALLLAYPLTVHFARPAAALALLAALAAYIVASFFVHRPVRWVLPPTAALIILALPQAEWLLYVPPVAVNSTLCWLFGRTLVGGRVPLIARFAMIEQGTLSPELARYALTLTWIWTLLFAAAAVTSAALALSGSRDAWSLFTNFLNYLAVAVLFVGEFVYRRLRFRAYRHHSPLQLLRNVRGTKLFER